MQFHYTLHFLNKFLNIHLNHIQYIYFKYMHICVQFFYTLYFLKLHNIELILHFLCNFVIRLTFKWTNYTIFAQFIFNINLFIFTIFAQFYYTLHFKMNKLHKIYSIHITHIHYLIFKYLQFGTNHYTLINIFQNAQITILIQSIFNIFIFLIFAFYTHFC